ncbi:MAG: LamG domain-containing protein [Acidobacteriota bacterium]
MLRSAPAKIERFRIFAFILVLAALTTALHAQPQAKGFPNGGKPMGVELMERQLEWERGHQLENCGPGQCIGGSYCDSCRCYAPDTDISLAFCKCRLADPSCGLGECIGNSWCEGPNCPAPVCYAPSAPISQVLCQGASLDENCRIKEDCGPGRCIDGSYCDDCQCYAPSAPISQVACRCRLMDPACGLGECIGSSWCEGPHCDSPVCYAPTHPVSLAMCSGAELDCECELTCATPPPTMTAWWTFDEIAGTTATDIAGGNHGSHQNGPTPTSGQVAGALAFDGVNDVVSATSTSVHDYTNLTVDAWIRPESLDPNPRTIVDYGDYLYQLILEGSELRLVHQASPSSYALPSNGAGISAGVWTHVAAVADNNAGEFRFYVNGQLVTLYDVYAATGFHNGDATWLIGDSAYSSPFKGLIDEVEIFERALTQGEIQSIYDAGPAGKCKSR